ncbi:hypothetical protein Dsin_009079 [Dipteronia sinensis]|uniref:Uncharacterized protein n=1 Tax=Dipteronia sinensis TaxID=43782 RepID=A0AAE0EBK1_9ROSI|nr:hypothetical protein Dsin_009079 [Dipteronia sinensis]
MSGDHAVWNPLRGAVTIYGTMLTLGVTLPLQPFIARFLAEVGIAPAQLTSNSYRIWISICYLWKQIGAKHPPTPQEIRNFYTLGRSDNGDQDSVKKIPPNGSKRRFKKETAVRKVATFSKRSPVSKVAKKTEGSSTFEDAHGKREVRIAEGPTAYQTGVKPLIPGEEDDDQETVTEMILREHRLKKRSDRISAASAVHPSDQFKGDVQSLAGVSEQAILQQTKPPPLCESDPIHADRPTAEVPSKPPT